MADVDEDVIREATLSGEGHDLSDETQDFRFLANISREDAAIPKRGEKDFEPHETALQSNTLAASRQAMHNALAFQRVHVPKSHSVATYHPETNMAYCLNPKGSLFSKMGHVPSVKDDPLGADENRGQRVWLLPEEVLYLLERGTLDVHWPHTEQDEEESSLPMSLQAAYAMFIGDERSHHGALSLERYSVYASLKRAGYTVMRAPCWDSPGPPPDNHCYPPLPVRTWQTGLLHAVSIWKLFARSNDKVHEDQQEAGPLVSHGLYRNYASIFQRLALISSYDPTLRSRLSNDDNNPSTDPNFRVTYHVWKPGSTTFKKSNPGSPDFRIAVINARETNSPTLDQLGALMDTVPYDPPQTDAKLYGKLKYGHKNLVLAVVDQGVTSYLRIADAAFGCEKLYEHVSRGPGGKRGGRGGGRGRGRGRDRG